MAGKTYTKAGEDVMSIVRDVMDKHHSHLVALELRVGVILVESEDDEPAIQVHGSPAAAKISRVPLKRRLFMPLDVVIEVDQSVWDELSDPQQQALFDHELSHVVVKKKRNDLIDFDADERPKLMLVPDDWVLSGFRDVVERWGADALEAQAISNLLAATRKDSAQALFDFMLPRGRRAGPPKGSKRQPHDVVA